MFAFMFCLLQGKNVLIFSLLAAALISCLYYKALFCGWPQKRGNERDKHGARFPSGVIFVMEWRQRGYTYLTHTHTLTHTHSGFPFYQRFLSFCALLFFFIHCLYYIISVLFSLHLFSSLLHNLYYLCPPLDAVFCSTWELAVSFDGVLYLKYSHNQDSFCLFI